MTDIDQDSDRTPANPDGPGEHDEHDEHAQGGVYSSPGKEYTRDTRYLSTRIVAV